jgi:SAM-dependent methyltransferase
MSVPGSAMKTWQDAYLQRFYYSQPGWQNGTSEFHAFICDYVLARAEVLELGPGLANSTSAFLSRYFAAVDGLDVDPSVKANQFLRQCYIYTGGPWPVPSGTYDAVVSDYVIEHLASPIATISEVCRVLRPGGVFLFRTPNLYHCIPLVSRLTPHWFHVLVANRLRNIVDQEREPFPTYYRMNTRRSIRKICGRCGLEELGLRVIEKDPSYGMSSRLLFYLFLAYERVVNSTQLMEWARVNILGAYRKKN